MPVFLEAISFSNMRCREQGIVETKVTKVGRKYFEVETGDRFEIASMRQVTAYTPDWQAYTSKQVLEEKGERNQIYKSLRDYLNAYMPMTLTLAQFCIWKCQRRFDYAGFQPV